MELQEILIDGRKIVDLMPHNFPMIMIDRLLRLDETSAETDFTITNINYFLSNSFFIESGIVENMAQTSTLTAGYDYYVSVKNNTNGYTPPFGYIIAIKNLKIYYLPRVGDVIKTKSTVINKIGSMLFVTTQIWLEGDVIAEAEMKVFVDSLV